jgi:PAS domain S-box-containing protein
MLDDRHITFDDSTAESNRIALQGLKEPLHALAIVAGKNFFLESFIYVEMGRRLKVSYPIRVFAREEPAIKWLLSRARRDHTVPRDIGFSISAFSFVAAALFGLATIFLGVSGSTITNLLLLQVPVLLAVGMFGLAHSNTKLTRWMAIMTLLVSASILLASSHASNTTMTVLAIALFALGLFALTERLRRQVEALLLIISAGAAAGFIAAATYFGEPRFSMVEIGTISAIFIGSFILLNRLQTHHQDNPIMSSQIRRNNVVLLVVFGLLQFYIASSWYISKQLENGAVFQEAWLFIVAGQLIGITIATVLTMQYITARRATVYNDKITDDLERERRTAEKTARQDDIIFGAIAEGLLIYDSSLHVTRFNPAARRLLGFRSSIIGKSIKLAIKSYTKDDKPLPQTDHPASRAIKERHVVEQTIRYQRHDRSVFDARVTASPMQLDGHMLGAIELFRDVTEERNLDRAKTEFVSLASHQLRTPLAAISWYSEMLTDADADTLNEQQMLYVKEIIRGNARMVELIESFLNVSRLEANRLLNYAAPTDVGATIQQVVAGMDDDIVQRNLAFTMSIAHNLPQMMVDPKLLTIVLGHVISNAIKYSPDSGRVNVAVKVGNNTDAAHPIAKPPYITITVSDTGYGIPNHQQQLVFSKMFRAQNIQTKDISGTGLGLYIIREIATLLGGAISFHSIENQGTTFQVVLPITTMNQTERNQQS